MADYERAYPVDTSAGSTETNSTAWVKNEQEHLRIYRLLNSQNAQLQKSINEVKTMLAENDEKLAAYNKKYTELMQALSKQTEDALAEFRAEVDSAKAFINDFVYQLKTSQIRFAFLSSTIAGDVTNGSGQFTFRVPDGYDVTKCAFFYFNTETGGNGIEGSYHWGLVYGTNVVNESNLGFVQCLVIYNPMW